MKKYFLMVALYCLTIGLATSCREEKTPGEKIEDGIEEVGDGIEDAADDVADEVEDAVD